MARGAWLATCAWVLGCLAWGSAAAEPWPGYQAILWQPAPATAWPALRGLGITAGKVPGARGEVRAEGFAPALQALGQTPFYVENIATDFYASYHRYTPGKAPNWKFEALRQAYALNPRDPALWRREPSLEDAGARAGIAARLTAHVALLGARHPLYYNLADESGTADLAANWDFDVSPASLAAFRVWLRGEYGTLAALNAAWASQYAQWADVVGMTTDAAIARQDGHLGAWSDFKAFMDASYAGAVAMGRDALHAASPEARAGLEGAQPPGWGGYDYGLLSHSVDVMELYDQGGSIDIAHALNPDLIMLTTQFSSDPAGLRALWHDALAGARGVVLWEEGQGLAAADGKIGPRGVALAPQLALLEGRVGAVLREAVPLRAGVAILYSQASFRLSWLMDRKAEHKSWLYRDSGWEYDHDNAWRAALVTANQALLHAGLPPRFVTDREVSAAALRRAGVGVLVLPHSVALSDQALAEIAAFANAGGVVVADVAPGAFDGHGTARGKLPGLPVMLAARLDGPGLAPALTQAGLRAGFAVRLPAGEGVSTRLWRGRGVELLGLERDVPRAGLGAPDVQARLILPAAARVRDVVSGAVLGEGREVGLRLGVGRPSLLELRWLTPGHSLAPGAAPRAGKAKALN